MPEAGDVIASKIASSASAGATGLETCAVMDAGKKDTVTCIFTGFKTRLVSE